MLGRHVYRVTPVGEAWRVQKDGEGAPRGSWNSREAAVSAACAFAAKDEPSKVTVENGDGTLADERAFGVDPGESVDR
jgi:hypothetical protein